MAAFSWRMRPEVVQPFWAALQAGEFITGAAEQAGTYREMVLAVIATRAS
jgi:hypothetical protein